MAVCLSTVLTARGQEWTSVSMPGNVYISFKPQMLSPMKTAVGSLLSLF